MFLFTLLGPPHHLKCQLPRFLPTLPPYAAVSFCFTCPWPDWICPSPLSWYPFLLLSLSSITILTILLNPTCLLYFLHAVLVILSHFILILLLKIPLSTTTKTFQCFCCCNITKQSRRFLIWMLSSAPRSCCDTLFQLRLTYNLRRPFIRETVSPMVG